MLARLKYILKTSIQYACVMHCTFEYVADFVVCNGPSMEPTLYSQNILLTERISTKFHNPNRGDIIVAISPTNPNQHICKRIICLPGDRISKASLNSVKNKENNNNMDEFVPKGFVWIEGDNSDNSFDSRYYGPIPLGLIKSRVICRIWPFSEMRLL